MARPDVEPGADTARPRLLHADEDRLGLVAATLARGGRFVLLVADPVLWLAALAFLRERLPGHTFVEQSPRSSDDANRAISDPLRDSAGVTIVLRITGRDPGPNEALNLRRESLVDRAANFLVVLEGDDAHARFLREAPDCYSYRHLLVVLEGEPPIEPARLDEDASQIDVEQTIERIRRDEADPMAQANQLLGVAHLLRRNNQLRRAQRLLDEAISIMTAIPHELDEDGRSLLAALYYYSAHECARAESYRRTRKALEVLAPIKHKRWVQFASTEGQLDDAIGVDLATARDAVRRAREGRGGSLGRQLFCLAQSYLAREDVIRARATLAEIDVANPFVEAGSVAWLSVHFALLVEEGSWSEAAALLSSPRAARSEEPGFGQRLDRWRAVLLMKRGENRAARHIHERLLPRLKSMLSLVRIAAEDGQPCDARRRIEQIIDRPRTEEDGTIDDLLDMHEVLLYVTELEIAAGGAGVAREVLDSRLEALHLHIERSEAPDPPWPLLRCMLLQADAYLKRSGTERLAIRCAEEAWQLADEHASVLASKIARRLAVAWLRLDDLDRAGEWLVHGLARAREHEHRGDEARLHGLSLWLETRAGGNVSQVEDELKAALAATGSVLVEASVLARTGAALGRRDLLQRAQQIYRSLPWPMREGACLEALGETQIAQVRYRTFGLVTRLAILERRSDPPPITADDD